MTTDNLHRRAADLLDNKVDSHLHLNQLNERPVFVTQDSHCLWLIKIVPTDNSRYIFWEADLLKALAPTPVPVAKIEELNQDNNYAWLITQIPQGIPLSQHACSGARCNDLFQAAGKILGHLHGLELEPLVKADAHCSVWQRQSFDEIIANLYRQNLIDRYTLERWEKLAVQQYFDEDNSLCHADYSAANIYVDGGKIVAVIGFDWTAPGPRQIDLGCMDVTSKAWGQAKFLDSFYQGYEQVRPLPQFYHAQAEFYRFYYTCLSLAQRQFDPALGKRLDWYAKDMGFASIKK